jgi:hypothetical protein
MKGQRFMKMQAKWLLAGLAAMTMMPGMAQAQWWQGHPAYLRALSDLRSAYWLIQHRDPNDPMQAAEEGRALQEIRATYNELAQASISDGRNIDDQPPSDMVWGARGNRFYQANELLHRANADLAGEEDNPAANGMRSRAIRHLGLAMRALTDATHHWNY